MPIQTLTWSKGSVTLESAELLECTPLLHAHRKIDVVQHKAKVEPEKVLHCDSIADGGGTSIYGSVLYDGGVYRMWYQATPKDWDHENMTFVAYAESDDGFENR